MRITQSKLADSTILVALVPLLGYVLAFAYESGYAVSFNIPPSFIVLNVVSILQASLWAVAVVFLLGFVLFAIFPVVAPFDVAIRSRLLRHSLLMLMVILI